MSGSNRISRPRRKVLLKDVNPSILCSQCAGYMIDATALVDCLHTFCRACILKHFEASGKICPTCNLDYRKRTSSSILRPDVQLQIMIYKMVSALHSKEKQRREEFYSSTGVRASSSCSDDSLLEDIPDHEPFLSSTDSIDFYSPEDSVSLSMEYYQYNMDSTSDIKDVKYSDNVNSRSDLISKDLKDNANKNIGDYNNKSVKQPDRRYLQCPAGVEMTHLQKFIRMKYGLSSEHKVDIIYQGEVLPTYLSLMDVAYSFNWIKVKPMRFFYRIFTHKKVQPIKIINTTSAFGAKQLQIVSLEPPVQKLLPKEASDISPTLKSIPNCVPDTIAPPKKDEVVKKEQVDPIEVFPKVPPKAKSPELSTIDNSRSYTSKERLMAQLQLQPNRDVNGKRLVEPRKIPERSPEGCFLREYSEPDKEEVKRFAEKRDREWRLLAERDESIQQYISKKRKKSKHSKSDVSHKKPKLHAEITPSDEKQESIKLKLKVTQVNGHKHKHRSGSVSTAEEVPSALPQVANIQTKSTTVTTNDSSKQELLKLRGVRHKNITHGGDDKMAIVKPPAVEEGKKVTPPPKVLEATIAAQKHIEPVTTKLRSDFTYNTRPSKDTTNEEQKKQTFLKTFQSNAKEHKSTTEKVSSTPESEKVIVAAPHKTNNNVVTGHLFSVDNNLQSTINNKERNMERMLKEDCTLETKRHNSVVGNKSERKVSFGSFGANPKPVVITDKPKVHSEKPKIVSNQFTTNPGFTVSKIDSSPQGVKRKLEKPAQLPPTNDHRPSLEITVIPQPIYTKNPNAPTLHQAVVKKPCPGPAVKRPPPDTIPLERIIKSNAAAMNKAGVSITPAKSSSETNAGLVLDLSQKLTTIELAKCNNNNNNNGLKLQQVVSDNKGLSNLQMLSKVATEQVFSTKPLPKLTKPQIPNLQSINSFNNNNPKPLPNLTKMPQVFRNAQGNNNNNGSMIRTLVRPQIQNQSIRNIPNPSLLLVRQQNQNRLNMTTGGAAASDKAKQQLNNGAAFKEQQQLSAKSVVLIEGKERVDSISAASGGKS